MAGVWMLVRVVGGLHTRWPEGGRLGSSLSVGLLPQHINNEHIHGGVLAGVRVPLAGLYARAGSPQGTVHACGAHAQAHRREAPQVHVSGCGWPIGQVVVKC